jgi:hypothetical protein
MRFARRFYTFLLLLLSLGLFCSELPESLSLSDDSSNDFVEDSSSPLAGTVSEVCKDPAPAPSCFLRTEEPTVQFPAIDPIANRPFSGRRLLQSLSVQRK